LNKGGKNSDNDYCGVAKRDIHWRRNKLEIKIKDKGTLCETYEGKIENKEMAWKPRRGGHGDVRNRQHVVEGGRKKTWLGRF